jgi:hypothetical protein
MPRNTQFQVFRGTQAKLNTQTPPLQMGEMYFATDTGNLFFGTPGFGLGYIQIGDTSQVNERLDQLILIMEATRRALVALACEAGNNNPQDFDCAAIAQELNEADSVLS